LRLDGGSVLKDELHIAGLTGRCHKEEHSSRWTRAFWAVFAAITGSGEEEQIERSSI